MAAEPSDQPPAYNSINTSTINIAGAEESGPNCDDCDGSELLANYWFEDKTTRVGFIQKVLAIKLLQMTAVTVVMGIFIANNHDIWLFMERDSNYIHLILIPTVACIATMALMICFEEARRQNPYQYVYLIFQPLLFACCISFPGIFLEFLGPVLVAWVTHTVSVFAVLLYSVFALQTELEFAAKHSHFLVAFVQIVTYAVIVPFVHYYVNAFVTLYLALILYLDYIYLFWDLEFMTTKKYWNNITPADFFDGAVNLHIDYYYIFTNMIVPKCYDPRLFETRVGS